MKKDNRILKGCKLTAALILLSGLTACTNPLTGIVEVAIGSFSEPTVDAEGDDIEVREWEVRKIEPDSRKVQEDSQEIEDEPVPLEGLVQEEPGN